MNWLYYLLEANLYLAAFYVMYKLLLQRSTFYSSNRYFLVLSVAAAFAIPLIQLVFLKPPILPEAHVMPYEIPLETIEIDTAAKTPILTLQDFIVYGYLMLALFIGFKFIISISKIVKIYLRSNKRKLENYTLVELTTEHTAFSFFNILFIHPEMAKNNAVLKHEIIHIKQKHSWDIVLLEFLKICCWFNPVVYLMKKDLTLLHEYIADEKTTAENISKHEYAMFLIENSMAAYSSSLVNQLFNQSILKSRINMLNKEKTANWARLKYLLAVPLGGALLCVSTLSFSKTYGYLEIGHQSVQQKKVTKSKQEKKSYYPDSKFDKDNNFVSLEKRAIIINGQVIADKNKYYGAAEADDIKYLGSTEAIKKYGSKIGKDGAVEITGKDVVMTPPPPAMPQASTSKPPKVKQDQVKFPPPRVKRDAKETPPLSPTPNKIKKDQVKFPPPIVKPDKKVSTANKAKLMEEIEIVEEKLVKKQEKLDLKLNKVEEVKVEKINKSEDEPAPKQKMEELRIVPAKKVQTLKIVPKDKTTAIEKRENYQTKEITTVKISTQKTSNIFSKAWTLYKPKPKEDKNDQC